MPTDFLPSSTSATAAPNLSFAALSCELSPLSPTDPPGPEQSRPAPALTLSDTDRTLLFAYFEHQENLAALATHLASQPAAPAIGNPDPDEPNHADSPRVPCALSLAPSPDYFDLLSWLNQPHIQSALEAHDQAVARNDRRRALEALRQSLDTADNPTNLRRAATTLLRSTIVRTAPQRAHRDGQTPPSPRYQRGEVSGGPATDGGGRARVRADSLQPLSPLPPLPPPTSRPTPNPDPTATFNQIAAALTAPQLPIALSTLHAFAAHPPAASSPSCLSASVPSCLPSPTFAGYPIPSDPTTWPDSLPATLPKNFTLPLSITDAKEVERTDTPSGAHSRWNFWAFTRNRGMFECAVALTRDGPDHPNPCWRLASFDIIRGGG